MSELVPELTTATVKDVSDSMDALLNTYLQMSLGYPKCSDDVENEQYLGYVPFHSVVMLIFQHFSVECTNSPFDLFD